MKLLSELGYALPLTHDADTGRPVDPAERYYYAFDRGPRLTIAEPGQRYPQVRGATLLALAQQDALAHELEQTRHDVTELQERVDFAERLLGC